MTRNKRGKRGDHCLEIPNVLLSFISSEFNHLPIMTLCGDKCLTLKLEGHFTFKLQQRGKAFHSRGFTNSKNKHTKYYSSLLDIGEVTTKRDDSTPIEYQTKQVKTKKVKTNNKTKPIKTNKQCQYQKLVRIQKNQLPHALLDRLCNSITTWEASLVVSLMFILARILLLSNYSHECPRKIKELCHFI